MKISIILYFVLITLLVTSLIAAEVYIESFTANSDGNNITVKWRTASEDGLNSFTVERSSNDSYFKAIHSTDAKGMPGSYYFVDEEAFMKEIAHSKYDNDMTLNEKNYKYRLKLIKSDKTFIYTDEISVAHNPSSIRRTWGMIKEMFK